MSLSKSSLFWLLPHPSAAHQTFSSGCDSCRGGRKGAKLRQPAPAMAESDGRLLTKNLKSCCLSHNMRVSSHTEHHIQ
ncbi:hypothetical protein V8C44DRAFT_336049 [Trichoderma aethiopicum]